MDNSFFLFKDIIKLRIEREEKNMGNNVHLSKKEIEALLKCIDITVMYCITQKWFIYSREKRELLGVSIDKLKEKLERVTDG